MTVLDTLRPLVASLQPDTPALIGVSGGIDSMVLFDCLRQLGFSQLVVAHLNHQLRGDASDADEALVRTLAARAGCDLAVRRLDVARLAASSHQSVETAGRSARHSFFQDLALHRRLDRVFLAHHADDQVETLLMNLLRGAGTHGLGAMRRQTALGSLHLLRPLLGIWRSEIITHARTHRVAWRDDATNTDRNSFRNRVRLDTLPSLAAALGREVKASLLRTAHLAAEDDAALSALALTARSSIDAPPHSLSVAPLRTLPPSLARRVLQSWLHDQGVPEIGFDLIEHALRLANSSSTPASLNLPAHRRLRRRAGFLFIDDSSRR